MSKQKKNYIKIQHTQQKQTLHYKEKKNLIDIYKIFTLTESTATKTKENIQNF